MENLAPLVAAAVLLLALAVDRWWGEPPARLHPVVWIGRYLGGVGACVAPAAGVPDPRPARSFVGGALAWLAGAVGVVLLAAGVQAALFRLPPWAAVLLGALALKPLLAWRMLHDEVAAVESRLALSLADGRNQLARLVSRDVLALDAGQVRESAIESLAENLNDSVVAPVFWFLLLGLPGAALYRYANTADAMWGYRGARDGREWEWSGKFAARADDVFSWLPARITAILLAAVQPRATWRALPREARRTPSPNSGWPMAAMALGLGIRLGKPGVYLLNPEGRSPDAADAARARLLAARAVALLAVLFTSGLVLRSLAP